MIGAHLQQHTDERAGLVVVELEPLVEYIENGEQPPFGVFRARSRTLFEDAECPVRLPAFEDGEHERVLGRKVTVERGFGDTGCDDDLVHRDIPH